MLPLILQMYINKKRYQPVAENKALGYCHYDQDIYIEKECVILFWSKVFLFDGQ